MTIVRQMNEYTQGMPVYTSGANHETLLFMKKLQHSRHQQPPKICGAIFEHRIVNLNIKFTINHFYYDTRHNNTPLHLQ